MATATSPAPAVVTDDHLVVPTAVLDPVVVSFDGQYVWSFLPRRDGVRTRHGWLVPWPAVLLPRLDGTARVQLADAEGGQVHFENAVSFGGNAAPLSLRDPQGHPLAIDKAGHLTRVFSETADLSRREIAEGTARALEDLRDRVGIDAHVSYGCLLGAVRTGHMIGHDSDSDLAYLSAWTHPADIVRESYRIEREMRLLGWKVVRMSGADLKLFLPLGDGRTVHVDVFGAFHVGGTFYQMGGRSGLLEREALTPASTVVLEGVELAAPADPERVLEFLYGPQWRVPDPAYQPSDAWAGIHRLDGWMRGVRTQVPAWNELYRHRRAELPRQRSSFAAWAEERMPAGGRVVDLGSGAGRDTVWFARRGHAVTGVDCSGAALRQTRQRLARHGVAEPDVRVLPLNDLRAALLLGAELAREETPPTLYARALVGCLDEEARTNLWRLCSMSLRRGGSLFLEYAATRPGRPVRRSAPAGLVRRVSTRALVREITAAGGTVVHHEQGPGHDFFDHDDPAVAWLEIRWTTDKEHPMSAVTRAAARKRFARRAATIPSRLRDLTVAVQENRRLNRRVAELTDLVTELLVPLADRDDDKARELLSRYRQTTLAP